MLCRRQQTLLLPYCLAFSLLTGCPRAQPEVDPNGTSTPTSIADVALSVPAGLGLSDTWQVAASEWEVSTGARCSIEEFSVPSNGVVLPPASADLAVAPLPSLSALIAADWLAPISDRDPAFEQSQDLLPGLRRGLSQPGGRTAGLPVACPVLACYFRADLLEAAGMSPPESWGDYQALLESLPAWAPGLTAVEPWSEDFRASLFLARAVSTALHPDNFSLYLDVEQGTPLIDEPPFVAALDDSLAAIPHLDERSLQMSPVDCVNDVLAGRAAIAIGAPELFLPAHQRSSEGAIQRPDTFRLGVVPIPGASRVYHRQTGQWQVPAAGAAVQRVTLIGFDGLIACAAARPPIERSAAWQLWSTLDAAELNLGERPWDSTVAQVSRMQDVVRRPLPGFDGEGWRSHVQATADSLNLGRTALDLPLPERERFRAALTQQISHAIAGDQTPSAALAEVREEWIRLTEEVGRRRVVNVYRIASGLSPLTN